MSPLQVWLGGLVKKSPKTQRELADEAGITEKHLSQMLTGKAEGSLSVWSRVLAAADQLHVVTDPAPDELTALREERNKWMGYRLCNEHFPDPMHPRFDDPVCVMCLNNRAEKAEAERDALREQIRTLNPYESDD